MSPSIINRNDPAKTNPAGTINFLCISISRLFGRQIVLQIKLSIIKVDLDWRTPIKVVLIYFPLRSGRNYKSFCFIYFDLLTAKASVVFGVSILIRSTAGLDNSRKLIQFDQSRSQ